jgi:hypothetical protein
MLAFGGEKQLARDGGLPQGQGSLDRHFDAGQGGGEAI